MQTRSKSSARHFEVFPVTGDATAMLVRALSARDITVLPIDNIEIQSEQAYGTDVAADETLQAAVDRVAAKFVGFSEMPLAVRVASEIRCDSRRVHRLHYSIAVGQPRRAPITRAAAASAACGWEHFVS